MPVPFALEIHEHANSEQHAHTMSLLAKEIFEVPDNISDKEKNI